MTSGGKMKIIIKEKEIEVIVTKKLSNKNTYLRIKKDLNLYVTTNSLISDKKIKSIIEENMDSIIKMYEKQANKVEDSQEFYFLGKKYDKIMTTGSDITLGDKKVFIGREANIDKWYKQQAEKLFLEKLNEWYHCFCFKIPYPTLTIRKMTTRWGVCNSKLKRVTLNLELIKKEPDCLDYVIVHELSHFVEMNHSNRFWKVVEKNYPNYKIVRKKMKNY